METNNYNNLRDPSATTEKIHSPPPSVSPVPPRPTTLGAEFAITMPPPQPPTTTYSPPPPTSNYASPSPDTAKSSPSPNKPRKIPTADTGPALIRRRTFNASRPKSRFGEPSIPIDSETIEAYGSARSNFDAANSFSSVPPSPVHGGGKTNNTTPPRSASFSQKTPPPVGNSARKDGGEHNKDGGLGPDEREVYRKVTAQLRSRNNLRMTCKLLLELCIFLTILGCLIASLTSDKMRGMVFCGLKLWKWFVLLMSIFSGMLITHWLVHIGVFFVEWKFILKKNVVYFTHGLKTSVEFFIWIAVILCTWVLLVKPDVEHKSHRTRKALDFVTWTIASLLIASFLWLIKNTLMKLLASSFHLNRFFDRIQDSVFHHYVLQTLSGRPLVEQARRIGRSNSVDNVGQVSLTEHVKSHKEVKVVDISKLHEMKKDKVPSYTMQLLVDVVSNSGLSTLSGMMSEDVVEGGVELDDDEITSEEHAIATAVRIFENIVQFKDESEMNYIDKDDLLKFMIEEEVDLFYPLIEVNEKAQISIKAFSAWVVKVFKDRVQLQHALNDNKTAVKQLNKIVSAILVIIVFVLWLLLTEVATTKLLLFFSSQLVVAAFIFGNTCKTIFEAIIFVFVMHPFDVGDRCVIDGTMVIVEEMNILTTVFLKADKEKVYYPNSVLSTKPISNYYRSPENMGDTVEFCIDFSTPAAMIGELKERVKSYLEANPQHWRPEHNLVVKEIENVNKIKMALFPNHTMNFQDFGEKLRRKSALVLELKRIFEELDIKYNLLPQEVILSNAGPAATNSSIKQL